jgi:hypothetical protein
MDNAKRRVAIPGFCDQAFTFLGQGAVELLTNGEAQAQTQLLKLCIGDPAKFSLPLLLYASATGTAVGSPEKNDASASALLTPFGGTLNLSFQNQHTLPLFTYPGSITALRVVYQAGGKLVNGESSGSQTASTATLVGFGNVGLLFQTGAWNESTPGNMGAFWLKGTLGASAASGSSMREIFGSSAKSYVTEYGLYLGLQINGVIDIKSGVTHELSNHSVPVLEKYLVNFSVDYSRKD